MKDIYKEYGWNALFWILMCMVLWAYTIPVAIQSLQWAKESDNLQQECEAKAWLGCSIVCMAVEGLILLAFIL